MFVPAAIRGAYQVSADTWVKPCSSHFDIHREKINFRHIDNSAKGDFYVEEINMITFHPTTLRQISMVEASALILSGDLSQKLPFALFDIEVNSHSLNHTGIESHDVPIAEYYVVFSWVNFSSETGVRKARIRLVPDQYLTTVLDLRSEEAVKELNLCLDDNPNPILTFPLRDEGRFHVIHRISMRAGSPEAVQATRKFHEQHIS